MNEQDDGPIEVCLPVAAADKNLPAGEVAYTISIGEQTTFRRSSAPMTPSRGGAKTNCRELAGPPREIYLDEVTGNRPHMEIAWPIR